MTQVFYAKGGKWVNQGSEIDAPPDPPPPSGGLYIPEFPIFGGSAGVPTVDNTPTELDDYKGLTKYQFLDYMQNEFAGLAGLTHTNVAPLMKGFHNFDTSIPADFDSSAMDGCPSRSLIAVHNMQAPHASLIDGSLDATIDSYVASCPTDRTTYAIINHEPENNSGFDAAAWRDGVAHFCQRVLQTRGTVPVVPGVCLINWSLHPNNGQFDENSVNPAAEMLALGVDLDQVIYTTDGYDTSPVNAGGAENMFMPTSELARSWGFSRFGISETACKSYITSDRNKTAAWIRELADMAYAQEFEYVMWFNSGEGQRAGPEGWYIYGDDNKIQWANVCAGNYPE